MSNPATTDKPAGAQAAGAHNELVTVRVAGELLGVPIGRVHDVFVPNSLTSVPLAPGEIVGLLNLRGRVVTALSLRRLLGVGSAPAGSTQTALGIEHVGESDGLLVDSVGEVMKLDPEQRQPNPTHMDRRWAALSRGVYRLDGELLIELDVDAALAREPSRQAA
ncbi:MAG TPA: chemotaxis protein CheW [Salinarimonas sp.]|nr:chemotaxis protein CheW [Salinarimonas sp.]